MDIRSFFGKKQAKAPENPSKDKIPAKKKRLVISDSDDDDIIVIHAKKQKLEPVKPTVKKVKLSETKTKTTAPADFFGSSKVRKEPRQGVVTVSKDSSNEIEDFSDEEIFNDADFMDTLDEWNRKEQKSTKQKTSLQENVTPPKPEDTSLSEKLAARKKGQSWKEKIGRISSPKETINSPSNDRKRPRSRCDDGNSSSLQGPSKVSTTPDSRKPSSEKSSIGSTQSTQDDSLVADDTPSKKGNYWAYKNREGPKNLGGKDIPEGAPNCLEGLTFVISGVLESLERDEAGLLIKRYGGRVTCAVSRKTSYLVRGDDVGVKKLETAEKFGTKQIYEDGLLDLIKNKPGKTSSYDLKVQKEAKEAERKEQKILTVPPQDSHFAGFHPSRLRQSSGESSRPAPSNQSVFKHLIIGDSMATGLPTNEIEKEAKEAERKEQKGKEEERESSAPLIPGPGTSRQAGTKPHVKPTVMLPPVTCVVNTQKQQQMSSVSCESWTEKYRPKKVKEIIGQQGDRSNVNKLLRWLKNWDRWNKRGIKAPFNKEEGSHLKAALLSGPPGIGKTTSATVCAKELGFSYLELNASDARSKKSIKESVAEILNNHTIDGLTTKGAKADKHVLIMDEVDGMAGNEDRGGVAELIALIKTSRIPILCICNNRSHQKIRSLSNYCFDLRFYKPRTEQVKGAMMSIAFKEGLKIPPPAMHRIVEAANSDIRQVLNHVRMWSIGNNSLTFDQASTESERAKKDANIGVFEIPRLFFNGGEETRKYTYADYNELYFQDYSMTPFFIHENYPRSRPMRAGNNPLKTLLALSNAADSICFGDRVGTAIKMQNWSLLPTQGHFSAIMPGYYMRGGLAGMTTFPLVLGQTSKRNRCDGLLQDLLSHMVLHVTADKRQLGMEYLPLLKQRLLKPMLTKLLAGVDEAVCTMHQYDLQRDDWDSIMELSTYGPAENNPASQLNTKTKAAFTRMYNKQSHMNPYATESAAIKKKRTKAVNSGENPDSDGDEGGNDDDEDAMIKVKRSKKPAKPVKKK